MSGKTSQDSTYIVGCTVSLAHVSSLVSHSQNQKTDSLMTCACSMSNTIFMRSILECEGRVYRGYENIYCENPSVLLSY
ncbi:hypothetical protein K439DRAFT_1628563 [Ramaria rubella]|nr:hypothetical protein K439DRAFT_1628563 [Ramaria rubella]